MNQSIKYNTSKQNIFGTPLYNFNNVCAYSNGNSKHVSHELNYSNGMFTGMKWQCVEYARRYIQIVYGVTFSEVDSAYEIPNATFTRLLDNKVIIPWIYQGNPNMNLFESLNNSLIIWAKDCEPDTPHGHVAVIVYANKDGIHVAEQNYDNNDFYRYISLGDIKNVTIISLT
jgi:hypothetical protein